MKDLVLKYFTIEILRPLRFPTEIENSKILKYLK